MKSINNSNSRDEQEIFKICNCGKVVYCNFLISLTVNERLSSCKFVSLVINDNGILYTRYDLPLRINLVIVLGSFINEGQIAVSVASRYKLISKYFKFFWAEINSAN